MNRSKNVFYRLICGSISYSVCGLLFLSPFIYMDSLYEFANLPQSVFIQSVISILFILWCIKATFEKHVKISFNPLSIAITAYFFWILFSLIWAHNRYDGVLVVNHILSCSLLYLIISNVFEIEGPHKWINRFIVSIIVSCTLVALIGCGQHLFNLGWFRQVEPPASTFGNKSMAAQYVTMILPIIFVMIFSARIKLIRYIGMLPMSISLLYLFFMKSRTGWVAFFLSVIFIIVALIRDAGFDDSLARIRKKVIIYFSVVALIAVIILSFLYPKMYQHVAQLATNTIYHKKYHTGDSTIGIRFVLWQNGLEMFKDRPFLGTGIGNFKVHYPVYHQKSAKDRVFSEQLQPQYIHNDYIQNLVELGIIGLFCFIVLFASVMFMSFRLLSLPVEPRVRLYIIGLTGGIVSLLALCCFSFPMNRAIPPLLLYTYMGIIASIYNRHVLKSRYVSINISPVAGISLIVLLSILSILLFRFNTNTIFSDKYFNKTKQMELAGVWDEVIDHGLTSCHYNPNQMSALSAVGLAYAMTNQLDKAIVSLKKVAEAYPYHSNALINLGMAYTNKGENENAIEIFKRVLEIKPDDLKILIRLGNLSLAANDTATALNCFTKAEKLDSKNPFIHANLGFLWLKKEKFHEAAIAYSLALKYNPNMPFAHKNLGLIYARELEQPEKAIYPMEQLIQMNPDDKIAGTFKDYIQKKRSAAGYR